MNSHYYRWKEYEIPKFHWCYVGLIKKCVKGISQQIARLSKRFLQLVGEQNQKIAFLLNPRAERDCYTSLERKFYADYGNPGRKKSILDDFANEAGVCTPPWCFFHFTCFRKMLTFSKVKGFRISFFLQTALNRMCFWPKIENFRKKLFLLSILGVFGKNQRFFREPEI